MIHNISNILELMWLMWPKWKKSQHFLASKVCKILWHLLIGKQVSNNFNVKPCFIMSHFIYFIFLYPPVM